MIIAIDVKIMMKKKKQEKQKQKQEAGDLLPPVRGPSGPQAREIVGQNYFGGKKLV